MSNRNQKPRDNFSHLFLTSTTATSSNAVGTASLSSHSQVQSSHSSRSSPENAESVTSKASARSITKPQQRHFSRPQALTSSSNIDNGFGWMTPSTTGADSAAGTPSAGGITATNQDFDWLSSASNASNSRGVDGAKEFSTREGPRQSGEQRADVEVQDANEDEDDEASPNEDGLIVGFVPLASSDNIEGNNSRGNSDPALASSRPGTESARFINNRLKFFGSTILQPLRDLQIPEKVRNSSLPYLDTAASSAGAIMPTILTTPTQQQQEEAERQRRLLEERDRALARERTFSTASSTSHVSTDTAVIAGPAEGGTIVHLPPLKPLAGEGSQKEPETITWKESKAQPQAANRVLSEEEQMKLSEKVAQELIKKDGWQSEKFQHKAVDIEKYESLYNFIQTHPAGTYEEFIEFLLLGEGKKNDADVEAYNVLLFENFYDEHSEYRILWNENLALNLSETPHPCQGRAFVPPVASELEHPPSRTPSQSYGEDDLVRQHSLPTSFRDQIRQRTYSEGERIKKLTSQMDKQRFKQQIGTAFSNVSSYALKPLRDMQLAEKLNAMNLEMEEEAERRMVKSRRREAERKEEEEMMRLKRTAEAECLQATRVHLLTFIKNRPNAKYHEWIEELHPENAHDGALLEGLGKTIDHRFFIEESDHRRLWNEHLHAFLEGDEAGRVYVPARAKQANEGEVVIPEDLLSGSTFGSMNKPGGCSATDFISEGDGQINGSSNRTDSLRQSDLIAFD